MHPDLDRRRKFLVFAYRRYLDADQAWMAAGHEAASWFPVHPANKTPPIGNPGSRVRKLHDRHEVAPAALFIARIKLESTRRRLIARKMQDRPGTIFSTAV